MAARVGDWYAFSRSQFCRSLPVYNRMAWEDDEASMGRILGQSALAVAAPLGGPVAVVRADMGTIAFPTEGRATDGDALGNACTGSGAADTLVEVFSNMGVLLARCRVPVQRYGEVVRLSWTKEEDLCVVTEGQFCLLYDLARGGGQLPGPSGPSLPTATSRPPAALPQPPTRAYSLLHGALVPTLTTTSEDADQGEPMARAEHTAVALVVATTEGVVTLDHHGTLRAVLHGDRQALTALPPARLPLTSCEAAPVGQLSGHDRRERRRVRTTALAFAPPESHDGGVMLLLWATAVRSGGKRANGDGQASQNCFLHVASWDDLLAVERGGGACGRDTGGEGGSELADSDLDLDASITTEGEGRDEGALHAEGEDDDEAAAKRRRKREKQREKQLKKKKKQLKKKKRLLAAMMASGELAGVTLGVIPNEKVSTAMAQGTVVALERCPHDASRVAMMTDSGVLTILSSDLRCALFSLDTRTRLNNCDTVDGGEAEGSSFFLHRLVWAGRRYALLHLSRAAPMAGPNPGVHDDVPSLLTITQPLQEQPFVLLIPLSRQTAVHGERLDWSYDGSDGITVVSEVDGARVITDCGCYVVQEVPAALAALCKLQAPFPPAREYLVAYDAYAKGRREGLVRVRAVLTKHQKAWEHMLSCLVEAACSERDREQQLLFLSAASFLLDITSCSASGADRIADAVTRLRVLDALRHGDAEETGDNVRESIVAAMQPSGVMPLTMGQYAVLGGLYQLHDASVDDSDRDGDRDVDDAPDDVAAGSFLLSTQPIAAGEGQVIIDRLLGRQAYQLALQVCQAYGGAGAKVAHVLDAWACSKVRDLPDARVGGGETQGSAKEAALRQAEASVVRGIQEVFSKFPNEASYMGCATVALVKGLRTVAFNLLRDEPPSGRKVLMLAQMGRTREAMRTATESGDADLLYLALSAVLASAPAAAASPPPPSPSSSSADRDPPPSPAGGDVPEATAAMLLSFPDALCCLLSASLLQPAWRRAIAAVLVSYAPPPCRWWFAARLGFHSLTAGLQGCGEGEVRELCAAARERRNSCDGTGEEEAEEDAKTRAKARKLAKKKRGSNSGERDSERDDDRADEDLLSGSEEDQNGGEGGADDGFPALLLPTLYVPKPPLTATALCLGDEDKQAVTAVFGRAAAFAKQPQSLPTLRDAAASAAPLGPRTALMKKAWGLDRAEQEDQTRGADRVQMLRATFGDDAVPASLLFHSTLDIAPFSVLAPSAMAPEEVLDALQRQQRLEQCQQRFAQSFADTRFVTSAGSVVDTIGLLAEHAAWAEADRLREAFKMDQKKFFLAKFVALCRLGKWGLVAQLLGKPPPLVPERRSFFSSASSSAGEASTTPPCGYEVVVDTLLTYKQHELAAEYVPGITTDPAVRVDWYVNRIGAPVMALEAAYVGEDVGLLRQILQRVPQNARARQVGAKLLAELEAEE